MAICCAGIWRPYVTSVTEAWHSPLNVTSLLSIKQNVLTEGDMCALLADQNQPWPSLKLATIRLAHAQQPLNETLYQLIQRHLTPDFKHSMQNWHQSWCDGSLCVSAHTVRAPILPVNFKITSLPTMVRCLYVRCMPSSLNGFYSSMQWKKYNLIFKSKGKPYRWMLLKQTPSPYKLIFIQRSVS